VDEGHRIVDGRPPTGSGSTEAATDVLSVLVLYSLYGCRALHHLDDPVDYPNEKSAPGECD
jgi:hypothetical protein